MNTIRQKYNPTEDPPLVLPSAPTDEEKYGYLNTRRLPLYVFGVFSFLSLSGGMWLFAISAPPFYWFGGFVGLLQIYLIISYIVGICGKDYDFESHKKVVEEHAVTPGNAPTVDIYLPCCKEPMEILENTYKHIQALQYPEGKLKVYVLDDGGMDSVKQLAESYGFNYITRDDKPRLKKAGNLRWAFARTDGDFFVIYDADFCPRADFLLELIPVMKSDPKLAIVQTPQFFRTVDGQTWVEQGAGSVQELFYRIVQINRDRWGASICVGSNAVYRREALVETGGTAEIGFSEDVHTGFYAVNRGWKLRYVPLCLACGICPDTPRAFFSQQMRWCMGSTTLLTNPDFWASDLSIIQKICYLSGMMYYSAMALGIFINPLPGVLLMWVRPEFLKYYNLAFAVPSLLYSLIAIRLWAKAKYSIHVQYIMAIQQYAYLTAIKDRLFGTALAWVPSGDTKAHKNNKYRNMRILCWCWTISYEAALISGTTYCLLTGWAWYNFVPILCLNAFNLFITHRFLFCP
ncbi:nucleotide-diphospho-sugar transferase [Trichophaea hybrida]|nr:nucleotide-diphospho-sugar transferase [Trichophaea hybrida]